MSNKTQNSLFHYIISNSDIDDIQSRFISYKLELGNVKTIKAIKKTEVDVYIFTTDVGGFTIKTVNLPIPITRISKINV